MTEQENSAKANAGEVLKSGMRRVANGVEEQAFRTRRAISNMRLYEAVRSSKAEKVQAALALDPAPDPDIRIGRGKYTGNIDEPSALYYAVMRAYYDSAALLIEAGADVNPVPPKMSANLLMMTANHTNEGVTAVGIKLMEHGADVNAPSGRPVCPNYLHALAMYNHNLDLFKSALRHGADIHVQNQQGLDVEELLSRNGRQKAMLGALRLHKNAPLPDVSAHGLSRAALEQRQDNGYCALDHWLCWDNYTQVQADLQAKGEKPLMASDLVAPLGGDKKLGPRLTALLEVNPDLVRQLSKAELWEGQSLHTLEQMRRAVPQALQPQFPYHFLKMRIEENKPRQGLTR